MPAPRRFFVAVFLAFLASPCHGQVTVPGKPLTNAPDTDIASDMVSGIDRFLLRKLQQADADRAGRWSCDLTSVDAYTESIEPLRRQLAQIHGVRDQRIPFSEPEVLTTVGDFGVVYKDSGYKVMAVRWPVLADPAPTASHVPSIYAEGLLLQPNSDPVADVIAVPHCDHSPEQIAGLAPGIPSPSQYARRLAECGCRVLIPTVISRERQRRNGRASLTHREYLHRSAWELGRHLLGYEIQKVLAAVDWLSDVSDTAAGRRIAVVGYGEGGHIALLAGALDTRIDVVAVSGSAGSEHECWNHPLDRNVFGGFKDFGTAELASLILPRRLIVDLADWPEVVLPGEGGAPAVMKTPPVEFVQSRLEMAQSRVTALRKAAADVRDISVLHPQNNLFLADAIAPLMNFLTDSATATDVIAATAHAAPRPTFVRNADQLIGQRMTRQIEQIDRHNQALLRESEFVRNRFLQDLDQTSPAAYEASVEKYRTIFRNDVIGHFDDRLLPANPRIRQSWQTDKWTGYEVVLDVFPDVIAYGVLLVPNDLQPSEKRPVVVCQHGLEGRPTDTFLNDHRAYHDFAAKLCERGFITFAPQNPYIFGDRFRTLQRKANPLGRTLFSVIVPQHQQIVNWLKSLSFTDPQRIAFYGLSYGGKSAMRIPPLVTDYCLSICSADFNEWVLKNASTRHNFSYVWTGEYEIFEWNLGNTFNYFEMAALICPRPFMVERGHFDGVGEDHWVAYEYAKVRHLYAAKMGLGDRTEIEWFVGPHTINGKGTFNFLHRHLNWPLRQKNTAPRE